MVNSREPAHCPAMEAGVSLECSDCGRTLGLPSDDGYLQRARSFIAAHQLCRPRSVIVHVHLHEATRPSLRLVSTG